MTMSSSVSKVTLNGDGVQTDWPFSFKVWKAADLEISITNAEGATTVVSNWSVSLAGTGGTVTYPTSGPALPSGHKITIARSMDFLQDVDLVSGTRWDPEVVETALDQATAERQQLREKLDRAITVDIASGTTPEALRDAIFAAQAAAAASASAAANSASEAEIAASSVGFISASGTLTAGNDTITLPFEYNFEAEAVAIYLGGVKQEKGTLTFVDSSHVKVGAAVTVDTVWEAVSVVQSGEGVLTVLRDQCLDAKTNAETAETNAEAALATVETIKANIPGKNLIINGDFRINQRSYVSGTNTTGSNQYTLDRWRVVTSGQNITFTDYLNGRQVTAPAGGIEQVVEDLNISGGTYVLNWEGTAVGSVNGTTVAKGVAFTLPAKTNATVKFTGGTVAKAQLEKGPVVTSFEDRFVGDELAMCKRYYERIAYRVYTPLNSSASVASVTVTFASGKRTVPTITRENEALSNTTFNSVSVGVTSVILVYNTTAATGTASGTVVAVSEL